MAVKWTDDQLEVINHRNKNLLVSAAAGSGKTAVLVERIIQMIMDEKNPYSIDEFIVLTFTNAAACEMKQKIADAIQKKLDSDPFNERLQQQSTMVHNAMICTIDSFCGYVVKNYFHEINIEPDYRIADSSELTILSKQILDDMIDELYEKNDEGFIKFVSAYDKQGKDSNTRNYIVTLHGIASAKPWPDEYLKDLLIPYNLNNVEELKSANWIDEIYNDSIIKLSEAKSLMGETLRIANLPDGPDRYVENIENDLILVESLLSAKNYSELRELSVQITFADLNRQKCDVCLIENKEAASNKRNQYKKLVLEVQKSVEKSLDDILDEMKVLSEYVTTLVDLAIEYEHRMFEEKRKRKIVDFNDIEHFALNILVDPNTKRPTDTAKAFHNQYREVMLDEYQDTNLLQETLLWAVSRESVGEYNRFFVGDVKQSIYRFRQADPTVFMEKFYDYETECNESRRIDLKQNFRSRKQVLDFTNTIFSKIMKKDLGNIEYDDEAKLYLGNEDYSNNENEDAIAEVIFVEDDKELINSFNIKSKEEYEAKIISNRIKKLLLDDYQVFDKDEKCFRKVELNDIVILYRGGKGRANTFKRVIESEGIDVELESSEGYFNAREVQNVLNVLRILDNPKQDIALTSVLHNMFEFDNDILALPRKEDKKQPYYRLFFDYCKEHPEYEGNRLVEFLEEMRPQIAILPIHEILQKVIDYFDYETKVLSSEDGDIKRANILQLIDLSISFENTSYRGLFRFVDYIEKMEKYEISTGAADMLSSQGQAVRIITMHHSKGLEYPIVFVSGLGVKFNNSDETGSVIFNQDLGIAMDIFDPIKRTKTTTSYKKYVASRIDLESKAEELRVLYVALTRAKEKLILTGVRNGYDKIVSELANQPYKLEELSLTQRASAKCYMEWILPALYMEDNYRSIFVNDSDLVVSGVAKTIDIEDKKEKLIEHAKNIASDLKDIKGKLEFLYPYLYEQQYKNKYSVSELKHASMKLKYVGEEISKPAAWIESEHTDSSAPNEGALRGTAMHRVLECYDFSRKDYMDSLSEEIQRQISTGKLGLDQKERLSIKKLEGFLSSNLANRMHIASKERNLHVEKAFTLGDTPSNLSLEEVAKDVEGLEKLSLKFDDSNLIVLIQGIIDAFFFENDEIVLVDYKTDAVKDDEELIKRYERQMQLYVMALERIFDKPVKEVILYSFALEKEVKVEGALSKNH